MDLFSQAEHDESAQAILLSPDAALHRRGRRASIAPAGGECRGREVIAASLAARGALILARDLDEACAIANRIAPEHLELAVARARARCLPHAATPARSSSAATLGGARRLLRRSEPRAADRAHGALLLAARRLRLPEAHERDPRLAQGARTLGRVAATLAAAKG